MQRMMWVLAGAAALAAAFLLGRCAAPVPADREFAAPAAPDTAPAGRPERTGADAAMVPGDGRPASPQHADAPAPASMPAATDAGTRDGTAMAGADGRAPVPTGPQPLVQEDLPKFARSIEGLKGEGGAWRDLLDLAEAEDQGAEARRLERRIEQSILRHGGGYTELRLASPHCTRSVCLMRAVGAGGMRAQSDWQQLVSTMINEPWYRQSFDDMRTSVSSSGGDVVYLTLFVRCQPGACRHAGR